MTATCGYQVVLCDTPSREATTVLTDYLNRDRAEKLFDLLKNDDGQHRLRTGRQAAAEGRIFIAFLALALRAETENRRRDGGLLRKAGVAEFLAEMGNIRAIRLPDGTRMLREVTKRQRDWLAAVGLAPPEVQVSYGVGFPAWTAPGGRCSYWDGGYPEGRLHRGAGAATGPGAEGTVANGIGTAPGGRCGYWAGS